MLGVDEHSFISGYESVDYASMLCVGEQHSFISYYGPIEDSLNSHHRNSITTSFIIGFDKFSPSKRYRNTTAAIFWFGSSKRSARYCSCCCNRRSANFVSNSTSISWNCFCRSSTTSMLRFAEHSNISGYVEARQSRLRQYAPFRKTLLYQLLWFLRRLIKQSSLNFYYRQLHHRLRQVLGQIPSRF